MPETLAYTSGRRRTWLRIVLLTLAGLAGLAILAVGVFAVFLWCVLAPIHFSTSAATAVAAQVVNYALVPNAAGIVNPPSTRGATCDGHAYVTVDPVGTTWVLFPTGRYKGSNLAGHLYRSTPATGPAPAEITVVGPALFPPFAGPVPYEVESQDGPNWYTVRFDMD